jgi:hypothetical protein
MSEERPAKRRKEWWVHVQGGARAAKVEADVSCDVEDLLKVVRQEFHERLAAVSRDSLQLYSSKDSLEVDKNEFQEFLASTWCKWDCRVQSSTCEPCWCYELSHVVWF